MSRVATAVWCLLLVSSPLSAQPSSAADDSRALALRFIDLSGALSIETMQALFQSAVQRSAASLPQHVKDKLWEEFIAALPREELKVRVASVYEEHFSRDELRALVTFYESPAGRKLVATQSELITGTFRTVQEVTVHVTQDVIKRLRYYLEGEGFRSAGKLDQAADSLEKAVELYPDDADFRLSLGRTLAALGRLDDARLHFDELARLRPGTVIDASVLPFVGLWKFEDKSVWIRILEDGRAFQCRIAPDDTVSASEGRFREGRIEWQEIWSPDTLSLTEEGLSVVGNGDVEGYTYTRAAGELDDACEAEESMADNGDAPPSSGGPPQPILFEPRVKRTFRPDVVTPVGTMFYVEVVTKPVNHALRIHLCGPGCNSATTVKVWGPDSYAEGDVLRFTVREEGEYYLWSEDLTAGGAATGSSAEIVENKGRLVFENGAVLNAWYVTP